MRVSAVEYPKLAKAYPTNKLPDLRGEFIRGWDDGRGIDTGRALLNIQSDDIKKFELKYFGPGGGPGTATVFALQNGVSGIYTTGINQEGGSTTANAFQILVGVKPVREILHLTICESCIMNSAILNNELIAVQAGNIIVYNYDSETKGIYFRIN
ncbi:hypothetical protein CSC22_5235 (plasmid) [Escherichia coli]|nr:hypothetical protein CSC22_5235 [Escherichia coli]